MVLQPRKVIASGICGVARPLLLAMGSATNTYTLLQTSRSRIRTGSDDAAAKQAVWSFPSPITGVAGCAQGFYVITADGQLWLLPQTTRKRSFELMSQQAVVEQLFVDQCAPKKIASLKAHTKAILTVTLDDLIILGCGVEITVWTVTALNASPHQFNLSAPVSCLTPVLANQSSVLLRLLFPDCKQGGQLLIGCMDGQVLLAPIRGNACPCPFIHLPQEQIMEIFLVSNVPDTRMPASSSHALFVVVGSLGTVVLAVLNENSTKIIFKEYAIGSPLHSCVLVHSSLVASIEQGQMIVAKLPQPGSLGLPAMLDISFVGIPASVQRIAVNSDSSLVFAICSRPTRLIELMVLKEVNNQVSVLNENLHEILRSLELMEQQQLQLQQQLQTMNQCLEDVQQLLSLFRERSVSSSTLRDMFPCSVDEFIENGSDGAWPAIQFTVENTARFTLSSSWSVHVTTMPISQDNCSKSSSTWSLHGLRPAEKFRRQTRIHLPNDLKPVIIEVLLTIVLPECDSARALTLSLHRQRFDILSCWCTDGDALVTRLGSLNVSTLLDRQSRQQQKTSRSFCLIPPPSQFALWKDVVLAHLLAIASNSSSTVTKLKGVWPVRLNLAAYAISEPVTITIEQKQLYLANTLQLSLEHVRAEVVAAVYESLCYRLLLIICPEDKVLKWTEDAPTQVFAGSIYSAIELGAAAKRVEQLQQQHQKRLASLAESFEHDVETVQSQFTAQTGQTMCLLLPPLP